MEFDNHDVLQVYNIERKMRNELWLVLVTVVALALTLRYLAPEKHDAPRVTPSVARALGWCEVKEGK